MSSQEKEIWEEKIKQKIKIIKEAGAANKYNHAGIYCVKVNGIILYIGKSLDMLRRVAQHMIDIEENRKTNKYIVFRGLMNRGFEITFDVLYVATGTENVEDEIGWKEGELIRQYLPLLNYQIPREDNYHCFITVKHAKTITAEEIINTCGLKNEANQVNLKG